VTRRPRRKILSPRGEPTSCGSETGSGIALASRLGATATACNIDPKGREISPPDHVFASSGGIDPIGRNIGVGWSGSEPATTAKGWNPNCA
jgi:hypothetical protein